MMAANRAARRAARKAALELIYMALCPCPLACRGDPDECLGLMASARHGPARSEIHSSRLRAVDNARAQAPFYARCGAKRLLQFDDADHPRLRVGSNLA
jgi:hypothetical protein